MKFGALITISAAIFLFEMTHGIPLAPCTNDVNATSNKCGNVPCHIFSECQAYVCNTLDFTCGSCNNDESVNFGRCETLSCNIDD